MEYSVLFSIVTEPSAEQSEILSPVRCETAFVTDLPSQGAGVSRTALSTSMTALLPLMIMQGLRGAFLRLMMPQPLIRFSGTLNTLAISLREAKVGLSFFIISIF